MRSIELIRLFSERYPQASFPRNFIAFVEEQEALGDPIRRAHTKQPFVEFLSDLKVFSDAYEGFLGPQSELALQICYPELLKLSSPELDHFFEQNLSKVFVLQEIVLDSETLTGFNRHGREHLQAVTRQMLNLMRYASGGAAPDPQAEREAIIAGHLHDIGNLLSRKEHGIYGLYLLTRLFTDVDQDPESLTSYLRVLEAVLFHEVEYGSRVAELDDLSLLTRTLIVADKTDVSLRRVSFKSNMPEAIRDAHMLVNLLTGDSHLRLHDQTIDWEIHFSPKMKEDDAPQFSALLKKAERVWVPAEWQTLYRRENIEYIFIFQATFLRVYFSRLAFAIRAAFSVRPSLETFRLVIQDDERGVSLTRAFSREDYQAKVDLIGHNLFKNMGGG